LRSTPDSPWVYDENEFRPGPDDAELVVSGIYLRLFNANPSWVLRKPREFMADLMENIVQSINSRGLQDLQKLETMTTSLVMLLASQPPLAEIVPATGYISRIYSVMGSLDESVVKAPLLVINELSR
jgi:DnaJ family protein C protein 13